MVDLDAGVLIAACSDESADAGITTCPLSSRWASSGWPGQASRLRGRTVSGRSQVVGHWR